MTTRIPQSTSMGFRQFNENVIEPAHAAAKQARHLNPASATPTASNKLAAPTAGEAIKNLSFDEVEYEDEDGKTLLERLLHPTPAFSDSLSALLLRAVGYAHGELILQLGEHNLADKSLAALFDDPGPGLGAEEAASTTASGGTVAEEQKKKEGTLKIKKETTDAILAALKAATHQLPIDVTLLHSPFVSSTGALAPLPDQGTIATPLNDAATTKRWTSKALKVLVRRRPESADELNEIRVSVVGNVDSGKSTILGVLTRGRLDDGRGRARVSLFRHKHEVESGRTSSVGLEILGFTSEGKEVLPEGVLALQQQEGAKESQAKKQQLGWEEIAGKSAKIVSFVDLAGHEKYLKTTLFGLTATSPDFVLLIVGANAGLIGMSKEHLSVSLALNVPVVCVVTKIDMTPPQILDQTLKQLSKILKSPGCRKAPVYVKDVGQAVELAPRFIKAKACPIFLVSNVTGVGHNLLRSFLNAVPPSSGDRFPVDDPLEFSISDCFSVPFVGTVVSGVILSGRVAVGDTVLLGPDPLGAFLPTAIKSIQRKRVNVTRAEAGQSVSYALKRIKRHQVRKGMVILAAPDPKSKVHLPAPKAVRAFEGSVLVLYHQSTISCKYQAMLHVGSVRRSVTIDSIVGQECLRTGDRATVTFRFYGGMPEWIKVGDKLLFREGRCKGLGVVTKLLD